jgi:hypothetical protein
LLHLRPTKTASSYMNRNLATNFFHRARRGSPISLCHWCFMHSGDQNRPFPRQCLGQSIAQSNPHQHVQIRKKFEDVLLFRRSGQDTALCTFIYMATSGIPVLASRAHWRVIVGKLCERVARPPEKLCLPACEPALGHLAMRQI